MFIIGEALRSENLALEKYSTHPQEKEKNQIKCKSQFFFLFQKLLSCFYKNSFFLFLAQFFSYENNSHTVGNKLETGRLLMTLLTTSTQTVTPTGTWYIALLFIHVMWI